MGSAFMQGNYAKKIFAPETSLILMCCFPTIHFTTGNRLVSLGIIITLDILVILLSMKRLLKRSRTDRKSLLLLSCEITGSILFGAADVIFYDKIAPQKTVNIVFVLSSLVFLIPLIIEIGIERANKL